MRRIDTPQLHLYVTRSDKTDHFAQNINFELAALHQSTLFYH